MAYTSPISPLRARVMFPGHRLMHRIRRASAKQNSSGFLPPALVVLPGPRERTTPMRM